MKSVGNMNKLTVSKQSHALLRLEHCLCMKNYILV